MSLNSRVWDGPVSKGTGPHSLTARRPPGSGTLGLERVIELSVDGSAAAVDPKSPDPSAGNRDTQNPA